MEVTSDNMQTLPLHQETARRWGTFPAREVWPRRRSLACAQSQLSAFLLFKSLIDGSLVWCPPATLPGQVNHRPIFPYD